MLDKRKKDQIIEKYKVHKNDTGSAEVQIAILTAEIKELTVHLREHKKDFSSRRGLLRKVGLRRRLLKFLEKDNPKSYENLVKKLKLKKVEEQVVEERKEEEETEDEGNNEEGEE